MMEEHNSKFIRLSLASSSKTDPEILAQIAASEKEDEDICCAIAQNINTPIDTLKYLCGWRATEDDGDYPHVKVSREVINNPILPISVLEELLDRYINSGWLDLLKEFSKLSRLNVRMIGKLSELYYPNLWLVDHPVTQKSPELLDKIAHRSREKYVILKILSNDFTSASTREYIMKNTSHELRGEINVSKFDEIPF
jgi:hypothetical protein